MEWNFSTIYSGFEDPEFMKDVEKLKTFNKKLSSLNAALDGNVDNLDKFKDYIKLCEEIRLSFKPMWYAHLQLSINSNNTDALKHLDSMQAITNSFVEITSEIDEKIASLDGLYDAVCNNETLKQFSYLLKELVDAQKYVLSAQEEKIISMMATNGSVMWGKYKNQIISNMKVNFDGKDYPLTELLTFAYSEDEDVRKRSYEAEIAAYKDYEKGIATALNAIKGEVLTICDLRGYESPLDMTIKSTRITPKILDALIGSIEDHLPKFHEYFLAKAKFLGNEKMRWYDMYAPIVSNNKVIDYETGKQLILDAFGEFSDELREFAQKAFDKGWVDVYPKEGKVGGAFCSSQYAVKESRILLNYGNTLSDVVTLAHELGHAFHSDRLWGQHVLNTSYPMVLAETASNFGEIIMKKYLASKAQGDDKLAILELELSDTAQVVVDIYSRFLFEKSFFEKRKSGQLSVEEIKTLMLDAQKKAYGSSFDENYLHPYMWTWKPHYYYVSSNFYNFPYAFGALFSKGLYSKYLNEGESFVKKFDQVLIATGKMSVCDVAKSVEIDVESAEFWNSSFVSICEDIDKFTQTIKSK